jgi:hypothetical protein
MTTTATPWRTGCRDAGRRTPRWRCSRPEVTQLRRLSSARRQSSRRPKRLSRSQWCPHRRQRAAARTTRMTRTTQTLEVATRRRTMRMSAATTTDRRRRVARRDPCCRRPAPRTRFCPRSCLPPRCRRAQSRGVRALRRGQGRGRGRWRGRGAWPAGLSCGGLAASWQVQLQADEQLQLAAKVCHVLGRTVVMQAARPGDQTLGPA